MSVYKNITLSAEEPDIEKAREVARGQNTTLNELFREWLRAIAGRQQTAEEYRALMSKLRHIDSGGKFTREQMNERR